MDQADNTQSESNSVELVADLIGSKNAVKSSGIVPSDPQVKAAPSPKRTFTSHYKQQFLATYDACSNSLERGALMRREGIYSSHIANWRLLFSPDNSPNKGTNKAQRTEHLIAEVEQLKKKLAQAQAIIDLQKKVSELLGTYILPHESKGGRS
jgi:hypothetical protein